MGKCGESCGKVCWGVGEVKGYVERGMRKCVGEVWRNVGKCVGVWGEVREDERCGGLWKSVLGCGGNFGGGIGKCEEVCWGVGEVRGSVRRGVGKGVVSV